jgi:rod shape-determining protein MreC
VSAPTRRQRRAMVVLLVVSLTLVTLDYRSSSFAGVRSATQTVFGPVQRGLTAVVAPVGRFLAGIPAVAGNRRRIDELERANADLQRQLRESTLTGSRTEQLRRLDLLAGLGQYRVVPASVVALGPSLGFEWTVTVDAGTRDGVRTGMTVVNGDGLVGRVKQVSPVSSVVVLAVDPGSSVGVRLAGSNQLGVATGDGLAPLSFGPLDPQTRARVGDRLVTGPYGGSTYVAGIPVGEISSVSADPAAPAADAALRPYVTFAALDLVGIVLAAPRTDPRDSVLPAAPTPTATPTPTPTPTPTSAGPAGTPQPGTPRGAGPSATP